VCLQFVDDELHQSHGDVEGVTHHTFAGDGGVGGLDGVEEFVALVVVGLPPDGFDEVGLFGELEFALVIHFTLLVEFGSAIIG